MTNTPETTNNIPTTDVVISSLYFADERRSLQPYGWPYGMTVAKFRDLPIPERWRLVQREVLADRWAQQLTLANEDG